jgi:hypothetical protein
METLVLLVEACDAGSLSAFPVRGEKKRAAHSTFARQGPARDLRTLRLISPQKSFSSQDKAMTKIDRKTLVANGQTRCAFIVARGLNSRAADGPSSNSPSYSSSFSSSYSATTIQGQLPAD